MRNLSCSHLAYIIKDPDVLNSPIVFASPHSGRAYSDAFLNSSVLDARTIRSSEDAFVDQLIDFIPKMGAPLIFAKVPRAYVDMNRSADELDPALIHGVRDRSQNPRITSGLGVIPRVVSHARSIYSGKLSMSEAQSRIDRYWNPYHDALHLLLSRARDLFGYSLLIDMHSMPYEAVSHMNNTQQSMEVVIGDRFGASANIVFADVIENVFENHGFSVSRNIPFAGAYITQRYGHPKKSKHAIQIELNRKLYLDEEKILPSENFKNFKDRLEKVIAEIIEDIVQDKGDSLAAE